MKRVTVGIRPPMLDVDELEARALGAGAPKIEDVLTESQLDMLAAFAVDAPTGVEYCALDNAVDVFGALIAARAADPCWVVTEPKHDDPTKPVVVTAFTGNGPKSEAAARLYAIARDAVLTLVLHARAKQREVDTYREALAAIHATRSPANGKEGGAD